MDCIFGVNFLLLLCCDRLAQQLQFKKKYQEAVLVNRIDTKRQLSLVLHDLYLNKAKKIERKAAKRSK